MNNMLQYYCTLQLIKSQCLDPVTSKATTGLISFVAGLLLFLRAPTMKKNNKAAALDATDPEDQSLSVPWIYVNPFQSSLFLVNPVTGT